MPAGVPRTKVAETLTPSASVARSISLLRYLLETISKRDDRSRGHAAPAKFSLAPAMRFRLPVGFFRLVIVSFLAQHLWRDVGSRVQKRPRRPEEARAAQILAPHGIETPPVRESRGCARTVSRLFCARGRASQPSPASSAAPLSWILRGWRHASSKRRRWPAAPLRRLWFIPPCQTRARTPA